MEVYRMEGKMKVAVLNKVKDMTVEYRPIPKPKDNEVLVKIKHVGICGSDIHYYEFGRIGDFVVEKPMILGHESGGEVVETGRNVTKLRVGDIVSLEPGVPCGKCEYCKSGRYNLCEDVVFMATPPYDGAFAEYVAYPEDMTFKLPDGMGTDEGALIEPLSVGLHAANMAKAHIGQTATILGSGCIGLVTMLSLKALGVTDLYVADVIPKRLEKAKELGATAVIRADETDTVKKVLELTGGKGTDLVFETAGNRITTQQTVDIVKRGGRIVLVGMAPDDTISCNFNKLISKEASINTVFRYRNLYPSAIKAVSSGLIPINKIVTDVFKFDEVVEAMRISSENKRNIVKAIVEF
jgi:L-iditol 2-dehydrogenase